MRNWLSSIILALSLFVGELHTFWAKDTMVQNWIISEYRPMLIVWNVKFAIAEILPIMYFAAWILYRNNKVNRTTIWAFFWLAIFDTIVYFYNYKLHDFGNIYFWFAAFWALSFYGKKITNWLGKNLFHQ